MVIPADMKYPVLLALDRACLANGSLELLIEAFRPRPPIVFGMPSEGQLLVKRKTNRFTHQLDFPFVVDLHAFHHNVKKSVYGRHKPFNVETDDEEDDPIPEIEPQAEEIPMETSAGFAPPSASAHPAFRDNPSDGRVTHSLGRSGAPSAKVSTYNPVPEKDGIFNTYYPIGSERPDNSGDRQTRGMFVGSRDEPKMIRNLGNVNDCWRSFSKN